MSILFKYHSSYDLTQMDPIAVKKALKKKLLGRVDQAYIFGSFSTGQVTSESDIDLILIKKCGPTPFPKRALEFSDLFDIFPAVDILVYTDAEFKKLLTEKNGFWRSAKASLNRIL